MIASFIDYFEMNGAPMRLEGDEMIGSEVRVEILDSIPRFVPSKNYSTGNFAMLREKHGTLQFDSKNGTKYRYNTILERTGWPPGFFKGKTVLECGCGAGPDTEVLLSLGARVVAVDLYPDRALRNIGERDDACFVQASIMDLPLKERSFDIVFCHQVLQHTPDPKKTMEHILKFVKVDGAAMVYSYAKTFWKLVNIKYLLRPLTVRMDTERLYRFIRWYAPLAYRLTNQLHKLPWGQPACYACIPFSNMTYEKQFSHFTNQQFIEYGIHETFDALTPKYDIPLSSRIMAEIGNRCLNMPFEMMETKTKTILRTVL